MKRVVFFALMGSLLACKKNLVEQTPVAHPKMAYSNLSDSAVVFGRSASFDLDGNGEKDIYFGTLLVGDPVSQQDKKQWLVTSSFNANLPVNTSENIPMLNLNDSIPLSDFPGYGWYNASSIVLSQKIIGVTGAPYWEGRWKDASHRFIPVQLRKNNDLYNGWVEISFDTLNAKLILHKAAVSFEPNKSILAGK